jgi:cyclase
MLKKRIVGVITVIDSLAVQSEGFGRYLPIGRPEICVENLDRWGVDEILIVSIDRSMRNLGPHFDLIKRLNKIKIRTPVSYGGGIRDAADAKNIISLGCERVVVDRLILSGDVKSIEEIGNVIGVQAVIASVPGSFDQNGKLSWYDYLAQENRKQFSTLEKIHEYGLVSEFLLIDKDNEGKRNAFRLDLVHAFLKYFVNSQIICFGGISEKLQINALISIDQVMGIGVGNFLNYTEHAVQHLRPSANSHPVREPFFSKGGLILGSY